MRKLMIVAVAAWLLTGCAAQVQSPAVGFIFTDVKAPLLVTSNSGSSKVGTASCTSILGLIATGDASVDEAAKSAGIKRIHHVDYQSENILGIYAKYTVFVYGE